MTVQEAAKQAIQKAHEMKNFLVSVVEPMGADIQFVSEDKVFIRPVKTVSELIELIVKIPDKSRKMKTYYVCAGNLAIVYGFDNTDIQLNLYCNQLNEALEYISDGKCKIKEEARQVIEMLVVCEKES